MYRVNIRTNTYKQTSFPHPYKPLVDPWTITLDDVESWTIIDSGVLEIIFKNSDTIYYYSPAFWNYFSVTKDEEE